MRAHLVILGITLSAVPAAHALDVPCGLAERATIAVDGLLDDWEGVTGPTLGGDDARDATLTVLCNHDGKTAYLALDARDDRLIRTAKAGAGDDRLAIRLGRGRVTIYPASPDARVRRKVAFDGKAWPLRIADGLREGGWAIELSIPLARIPGFEAGTPLLPLDLTWSDADLLSETRAQETIASGVSSIAFAEGDALFRGFLEQHRLTRADVKLDVLVDVDGQRGKERVIWAGRVVGVLSDEAGYLVLPAAAKDVLEVKPIDVEGKGTAVLVARWLEHGGGGSREVLGIFVARGGGLERLFAHELAKRTPTLSIANTIAWQPAGKKKRGKALVIKLGEARGVSEATWREAPAEDMVPILLPWAEATEERWTFEDGQVSGGAVEPKQRRGR